MGRSKLDGFRESSMRQKAFLFRPEDEENLRKAKAKLGLLFEAEVVRTALKRVVEK